MYCSKNLDLRPSPKLIPSRDFSVWSIKLGLLKPLQSITKKIVDFKKKKMYIYIYIKDTI